MSKERTRKYREKVFTGFRLEFWKQTVVPTVLHRDHNKCINCDSTKTLDIHHKKYDLSITIDDLETLCRKCHKLEHNV